VDHAFHRTKDKSPPRIRRRGARWRAACRGELDSPAFTGAPRGFTQTVSNASWCARGAVEIVTVTTLRCPRCRAPAGAGSAENRPQVAAPSGFCRRKEPPANHTDGEIERHLTIQAVRGRSQASMRSGLGGLRAQPVERVSLTRRALDRPLPESAVLNACRNFWLCITRLTSRGATNRFCMLSPSASIGAGLSGTTEGPKATVESGPHLFPSPSS